MLSFLYTRSGLSDNEPTMFKQFKPLAVILLLLIGGCASQIKELPTEAQVDIPEQWDVIINEQKGDDHFESHSNNPIHNGWLQSFGDDDLNTYVQVALNNNPNLLASAASLKSAIEGVTINGASLWPSVSATVRDSDVDTKTNGIKTEVRTVSGTLAVNWEADIWGKLTQRKRSASYNALAQSELYKSAEFSLVANVSRAWYNLITNKLQLDLAHQRLDSFKRTADLIDENYKRGLRSALDVYLSRTDVQLQISSLSDAQFNYSQSLRVFKTLLGEYPNITLEFNANLPELNNSVPAGLPAQLLTRRPDLRASQLQYKAQIASAKAANRDRYPSISFTGSIGDSRDSFNKLFENNNLIMSLIAGVSQPLFQAGALKSREKQALYQAEMAYASLLKTTLNAFQEVENSLSREELLKQQHQALKSAVEFAQGGLDLALDRYQSGIENYTTVLESQRRLFNSKRNEINIRNALLQNRIGLHLALGGDFMVRESTDNAERDPTKDLPTISATDSLKSPSKQLQKKEQPQTNQ